MNSLKDSLNLSSKVNKQVKNQQHENTSEILEPTVVVSAMDQWQLDKILTNAGVGRKVQDSILHASEQEKKAFVGWLLFALSVSSIHYPVLFAHKRRMEDLPPEPFLQLAQLPTSKCYQWLIGGKGNIPPHLQKAIQDLRKLRGHEKLLQLGAVHPGLDEWISKNEAEGEWPVSDATKRKRYVPPIAIRSDGMTPEQAWEAARGQLQAEVDRVAYETWVRDVEYIGFEDGTITLGAANVYTRDWLEDRLTSIIERVLTGIIGQRVKVEFVMI